MKGLLLLCGILASIHCIVFKDALKFYVGENFVYMGMFIGHDQSRANTHYRLLAKFKRPIDNLLTIDPNAKEAGAPPTSLVYDLFIYLGEDKYLSAEATQDC